MAKRKRKNAVDWVNGLAILNELVFWNLMYGRRLLFGKRQVPDVSSIITVIQFDVRKNISCFQMIHKI
jgi:hypothetical protein